ncbi:MAG: hypothetical protein JSR83_17755 [Proteobacteria bacterium]|nr:hypothetical protein [Pseudomonadota bacterium]
MSVSKEIQKKAIAAVVDVNPGAIDCQVIYSLPEFLNGQLVVVEGSHQGSGDKFTNHVYVSGKGVRVAKNQSHFAHLVAEEAKKPSAVAEFTRTSGIAGVIAIIITLTICYMFAFLRVTDVPAVLSTSLATILGFYFGTKATHHDRHDKRGP